MRKAVTGVRIEVETEQAAEHPKVYTRIELKYLVRGRGLKEKDIRRVIELSNTQFCSAAIMLGKSADIETSYEIEEGD
jgi:putative redox protein